MKILQKRAVYLNNCKGYYIPQTRLFTLCRVIWLFMHVVLWFDILVDKCLSMVWSIPFFSNWAMSFKGSQGLKLLRPKEITSEKQESDIRCVKSNTLIPQAPGQPFIPDSDQSFRRCSASRNRYFPLHSQFLAINEGGSVSRGFTLLARGGACSCQLCSHSAENLCYMIPHLSAAKGICTNGTADFPLPSPHFQLFPISIRNMYSNNDTEQYEIKSKPRA